MFSPEKIKEILESGVEGASANVHDMTGTSDHFEVTVISEAFSGKSLIERHRVVYGVLGKAVGGDIHALSLKTWTPDEAEKRGIK